MIFFFVKAYWFNSWAGVLPAYLCSSVLMFLQFWGTSWSNDQVIVKNDKNKAKQSKTKT